MKVFLSYPYRDHEIAEEVRRAIRACGAEVLSADTVAAGGSLSSAIASRVAAADAFVVLVTRSSGASQWPLLELGAAVASEKRVIPLLAEDGAEMPLIVRDLVYLDIRNPAARPAAFAQLCEALAARSDVTTGASTQGLRAVSQASEALRQERDAYERSSRQQHERSQKMLLFVAAISVAAAAASLLITGGSHSSGLAALASGIVSAIAGALGFYVGSHRRTEQDD